MQAGALTLMTLMLTGIVRSGTTNPVDYLALIDTVTHAEQT